MAKSGKEKRAESYGDDLKWGLTVQTDNVFCTLCKVIIKCNKISKAKHHIATKGHQTLINA